MSITDSVLFDAPLIKEIKLIRRLLHSPPTFYLPIYLAEKRKTLSSSIFDEHCVLSTE